MPTQPAPKTVPFQKIVSLVERRKLFQALVEQRATFSCKLETDEIITFEAVAFELRTLSMSGFVLSIISEDEEEDTPDIAQVLNMAGQPHVPKNNQKLKSSINLDPSYTSDPRIVSQLPEAQKFKTTVFGNFEVDSYNYFFKSDIEIDKKTANPNLLSACVPISSEIYKLERRRSLRIEVPDDVVFSANVISVDHNASFLKFKVVDVSSSGARLSVLDNPYNFAFSTNSIFKLVLHPPSKKVIEVDGVIKHILSRDNQVFYGIEFQFKEAIVKNRLFALTMDMQRLAVLNSHG